MKIDLKNGALVLLLALAIPSAQAALPNVSPSPRWRRC
jgi:hypothetical protein